MKAFGVNNGDLHERPIERPFEAMDIEMERLLNKYGRILGCAHNGCVECPPIEEVLRYQQHEFNQLQRKFGLFSHDIRTAAEKGDAAAQNIFGAMYERGLGDVEENLNKAVGWITEAANEGYAPAQYRLAEFYLYGTGVPEDPRVAKYWLKLHQIDRPEGTIAGYEPMYTRWNQENARHYWWLSDLVDMALKRQRESWEAWHRRHPV